MQQLIERQRPDVVEVKHPALSTKPLLSVGDSVSTAVEEYVDDYVDHVGDEALKILAKPKEALVNLKTHIARTEKTPETSDASLLGNPVQWQAWCYVLLGCEDARLRADIDATLKRWMALPVRFLDLPAMLSTVTSLYTRDLAWLTDVLTKTPFPRSLHLFNAMIQVKPTPLSREAALLIVPAAFRAAERQRWAFNRKEDGLDAVKDKEFGGTAFAQSLFKWLTPYAAHAKYVAPFPDRSAFPDTATYCLDLEAILDEIYEAEEQYPSKGPNRTRGEKLTIHDYFTT